MFYLPVANPSEILLFRKNKVRSEGEDNTDFAADVMDNINPSDLGGSSMEDLLSKYFSTTDDKNRLKLLSTKGIASMLYISILIQAPFF